LVDGTLMLLPLAIYNH